MTDFCICIRILQPARHTGQVLCTWSRQGQGFPHGATDQPECTLVRSNLRGVCHHPLSRVGLLLLSQAVIAAARSLQQRPTVRTFLRMTPLVVAAAATARSPG
jgi:hypothetical protein